MRSYIPVSRVIKLTLWFQLQLELSVDIVDCDKQPAFLTRLRCPNQTEKMP